MVEIKSPPPPFLPPDEEIRKKFIKEQVLVQAALFITFLFYAIILILGRLRYRGNSYLKGTSTTFFMIAAYIVTYIPGLMSAPGQANDLYVFWIAFIAYLAAVTNEMSCYTRGDNEDRKKRLTVDYTVVWPLIATSLYQSLAAPEVLVPILIIFWVVFLKFKERTRALLFATDSSNGLCRATQVVSDLATYQKQTQINNSSYGHVLVGIKEAQIMSATKIDLDSSEPNLITLDKVFDTDETYFVTTSDGKEIQNTCFSFGMFFVLLSKIAGYENVDAKILVRNNQIPLNSFILVEKELEFLYDYLFTNYYAIYDRGIWRKLSDLGAIILFFWLTLPLLVEYRSQDHNILYVIFLGGVLDTGFTRFVILAIIAIEFTQIGIFLTSKWAKVMYTCAYLRSRSGLGTTRSFKSGLILWVLKRACCLPRPRISLICYNPFSKRNIGQYAILKCYGEITWLMYFNSWIGSFMEIPRIGQAGDTVKTLPSDLKDSIHTVINSCLETYHGKFTKGVNGLKDNDIAEEVIRHYVRTVPGQARVILIWHIATSLLEVDPKYTSLAKDKDFLAATTISNYTAYLVAKLPKMLSDHVYTTQREFDEAVNQIKLEKLADDMEKAKVGLTGHNSVFKEAQKLREVLENHPTLWKTLAAFWIEMLLFLALSEHEQTIGAHTDTLCVGGEFITHLWALLKHAGCSRETPI